jgi:uncharacterized protein (TIGR03083 family)
MADLGTLYDDVRREVSDLVASLDPADLHKPVPATPGWDIQDVVAHMAGVAEGALAGNFPSEFFSAFGQPAAVRRLNSWTSDHVAERKDEDLETILAEWEKHVSALVPMLNGEVPMSPDAPPFPDRIMLTDTAVHQQDIFGALGIERGRDAGPVKVGSSSYAGMMDIRLRESKAGVLLLDAGTKQWTVGGDEPEGSVRASRFEFFRALSGRRSPGQIKAYEWSIDPDRFVEYFYPYGVRDEALEE